MTDYMIVVHPKNFNKTARWIIDNLSPDQYPGINQFVGETDEVEYWEWFEWEAVTWFEHHDTVPEPRSAFGKVEGERTPRRYHLICRDEATWVMLKLIQ